MPELSLVDERFDRAPSGDDKAALNPFQLLAALRRSWFLILFCGLAFGVAAYVYTVTSVPKRYTTSGTVSLDLSRFTIPALQGAVNGEALPDPMPMVRSEVQILTSRALLQQVASDLNLYADPEFNASLRPPAPLSRLKRELSRVLPPSVGTPLIEAGLLPDVSKTDEPVPEAVVRDGVLGAIQHDLSIINDNRSLIIVVQFTATDANVAASVVNTLVRRYLEDKAQGRVEANSQANRPILRPSAASLPT